MSSQFPTAVDALVDNLVGSQEGSAVGHAGLHNAIADAAMAVQTEVRGHVFNVKHYGARGDGVTDDVTAIQAAYTALVAAGGGELHFPAGTYLCSNGASTAAIRITRDNAQSRRITRIYLSPNATIMLSANTPRFIDFNKVADHDWFGNLIVEGGTVDANNIGGQHHVLIGTYQAGSTQQRISIGNVLIRDTRLLNVRSDQNVGTNHRLCIWLVVDHPASGEATQDTISNITVSNVRMNGGNAGVAISGQADTGSAANVFIDNVLIEDCYHDTGITPALTTTYASSGYHIGSEGQVGRATVRNCVSKRAGDTGIEVNGGRSIIVQGCTVDDSAGPSFYISNYYSLSGTSHTLRDCEARWTGAWTGSGATGLNHSGYSSQGNALDAVTMQHCVYRSSGGSYAMDTSGALSGLAVALLAPTTRVHIDRFQALVDTFAADNAAFANPLLISAQGASQVRMRDVVMRWTGTHPGAGAWSPRYLDIRGTLVAMDVEGVRFYEDWGASVGAGNIRAVQFAVGAANAISGRLARLVIERLSDDTGPDIVHMLGGAGATISGRFTIEQCDFSAATAGTEVNVAQAGEAVKLLYGPNVWRTSTVRASTLWSGSGAPSASMGNNGDFYFRLDGGASTHLYFKSGGAWAGLI